MGETSTNNSSGITYANGARLGLEPNLLRYRKVLKFQTNNSGRAPAPATNVTLNTKGPSREKPEGTIKDHTSEKTIHNVHFDIMFTEITHFNPTIRGKPKTARKAVFENWYT